MAAVLLETKGLSKHFGHFAANREIDFSVRAGELRAVIGPNGAGKTTFFNVIAGTIPATAGSILFDGAEVTRVRGSRRVHLGIAKAFQTANFYADQTVFQNCRLAALAHVQGEFALHLFARSTRLSEVDRIAGEALEHLSLGEVWDVRAGDLSHGDKKRLDIAVALATRPKILLLDEPVAGMSIDESRKTDALIRRLAQHITVIIIEHDMDLIMGLAETITVMHQGRILAQGTPTEIRASERVQEAYLGGHAESLGGS
ncbi:MAG: ABC transporter ATP-binding protein [Candidatus Eremiobacteraeota bacterium]|nr:ABC transporter ATP-binding protein [Candidatus Eremiobacteraeota bacterium]MBV8353768.1 ABC transporter ATP-binding protein [Candidatus Eremiobacteraeota bacterium]